MRELALNMLAYPVEGETSVKSRRTARGKASGREARGCGREAGGGSRNAGLARIPRAWFMEIDAGASPKSLAPDAAPFHDVLETKGVRRLASQCLNTLCPSNEVS